MLSTFEKVGNLKQNHGHLYFFQELEQQIKAKEKEVEKVEQCGLSLIQNKKEEVSVVVMNTLQKLNHSWANLDHMVSKYGCIYEEGNFSSKSSRWEFVHVLLQFSQGI